MVHSLTASMSGKRNSIVCGSATVPKATTETWPSTRHEHTKAALDPTARSTQWCSPPTCGMAQSGPRRTAVVPRPPGAGVGQEKAAIPVIARPMTRVCTSSVPS